MEYIGNMRIAFFADSHAGYKSYRKTDNSGTNIRELDGYNALSTIVDQIIEEHEKNKIDIVLHGGDLFHSSVPSVKSIYNVQKQLTRLALALQCPIIIVCGNHEYNDNISSLPSTAALCGGLEQLGIIPIYEPVKKVKVKDVAITAITHAGVLLGEDLYRHKEATPVKGMFNICLSHGAAWDEAGTLQRCMDSPRELILDKNLVTSSAYDTKFDLLTLGHIHSRLNMNSDGSCFYAGSALRRGFSDSPGRRGWTLLTIDGDGGFSREDFDIWQRPQEDVKINVSGLSASEGIEKVEESLKNLNREGAIIRHTIVCDDNALRKSVVEGVARLRPLVKDALWWQIKSNLEGGKKENTLRQEKICSEGGLLEQYKNFLENRSELPKIKLKSVSHLETAIEKTLGETNA